MSIHDGHRERVRARYLAEGLDGFSEVNVLEFLLFYCFKQGDTNALAHALLDHFGSLTQVLEAPVEELIKVKGIKEKTAIFLTLINATGRYYQIKRAAVQKVLNTVDACGEYLMSYFVGRCNECVYLLCLDAKCKVLCCKKVGEGSINSAAISVRSIVEIALGTKASTVVLAHNHPSGLALPSGEDVLTTRRVAAALSAVDVRLADHIVVADDDFVSLAQSGYYHPEDEYTVI